MQSNGDIRTYETSLRTFGGVDWSLVNRSTRWLNLYYDFSSISLTVDAANQCIEAGDLVVEGRL